MKNILIIAAIILGMVACGEKEEVAPNKITPTTQRTNHVRITINSYKVGDYLDVQCKTHGAAVYYTRLGDEVYYLCNLVNNIFGVISLNGCDGNTMDLHGTADIYIEYKGDVTVEYLDSTL